MYLPSIEQNWRGRRHSHGRLSDLSRYPNVSHILPSFFIDFFSCIFLNFCNKTVLLHDYFNKNSSRKKKKTFLSVILTCLSVTLHPKKLRSWMRLYQPTFWLFLNHRKLQFLCYTFKLFKLFVFFDATFFSVFLITNNSQYGRRPTHFEARCGWFIRYWLDVGDL